MYDLQFEPKNENDLIDILIEGIGDFEVISATSRVSKNNNPMIELKLKVWDSAGAQLIISDYLMLGEKKFFLKKIRHFCYSAGLDDKYELGKLNAIDCSGKTGKLKIGIQKDETGKYPDKNCVNDYIFLENNSDKKDNVVDKNLDDDIPF